jgi:hypothetical protein
MRTKYWVGIGILGAGVACIPALTQTPPEPQGRTAPSVAVSSAANPESGPFDLNWTPPGLAQLTAQATAKSSFALDRTMLSAASSLLQDSDAEVRQSIGKLDGISVLLLRFGGAGIADESQVEAVREAYHLHGWKHLATTTGSGGPVHNGTTDLWLMLDGVNVRGAVLMVETPKNIALITFKGNLSPVDLLRLRGHFGIPRFEGDGFKDARDR